MKTNCTSTNPLTIKKFLPQFYYYLACTGSNPIDVTDPRWEMYILVRKAEEDSCMKLLGFAAVYRFHRYPDSMRMRLGQVCLYLKIYKKLLLNLHVFCSDKFYCQVIIKICCVDDRY